MSRFRCRFALALLVCWGQVAWSQGTADPKRNENRKIRATPGPQAARIGSAVNWATDWEQARARSKETGKPIFWYVPSIPGTFMDRKVEIDRYLMAGPFSNPAIISHLNQRFVPLRAIPDVETAKRFELEPYKFVEPGFLIVNSSGEMERRIDHLTTLHADWLARWVGVSPEDWIPTHELEAAWRQLRSGADHADGLDRGASDSLATEKLLLAGMFAFRRGEHDTARRLWREASEAQPDHPLAWKAAAEAEGLGPFCRGFEVYSEIPEAAWQAGIDSIGSAAPAHVYSEDDLWIRGTAFLLQMQRADGAFVDSDYDFGGYDSLPNVHAAITALCGLALIEARPHLPARQLAPVDLAIQRAADFVANDHNLNPNDQDEILWAYAYRTRLFARLLQESAGSVRPAAWLEPLQHAVRTLENVQLKTGGWAHEYANPFVTATALTALYAGQEAGAKLDSERLEAGLKSLLNDRYPNGAYPYSSRRRPGERPVPETDASAGRMAIGELALWRWRRIDDHQLQQAAEISFAGQEFLDRAYKYDNHTSTLAYGGFFFWYDMQARAELIASLPDREVRSRLARAQYELTLSLPELDGCFVDSHELGRCYGTAMALQSLALLGPEVASEPAPRDRQARR